MKGCRAATKMTMRTFLKIVQSTSESIISKHWSTSNTLIDGCRRAFNASYNALWHFILHLPSVHNNLECVGILRVFTVTWVIQCKVDRPQITHCVDILRYKYVASCYFKRGGGDLAIHQRQKLDHRHSTTESLEQKRKEHRSSKVSLSSTIHQKKMIRQRI